MDIIHYKIGILNNLFPIILTEYEGVNSNGYRDWRQIPFIYENDKYTFSGGFA